MRVEDMADLGLRIFDWEYGAVAGRAAIHSSEVEEGNEACTKAVRFGKRDVV